MARQRHGEATPGECTFASARRWASAAALAGLESEASPTSVPPVTAPPLSYNRDRTSHHASAHRHACTVFPCAASALSAFVGRAAGSQCAPRNFWEGHDPTVRRPRAYCDLARIGHRLNMRVWGKACVGSTGSHLRLARASATRFILRSRDPVERLVRDAVLSEKEAQLGRVFLYVTHGVQE
jgi:hypothetical protein